MTTPNDMTIPDAWPDIVARIAEIKRLIANLPHDRQIQVCDPDDFEHDMATDDLWLALLGIDSFANAAQLLNACHVNWRPLSTEPAIFYDMSWACNSLPVLALNASGTVMLARVHGCEDTCCPRCPSWSSVDTAKGLPSAGPRSLIGWLDLDDVLALRGRLNIVT